MSALNEPVAWALVDDCGVVEVATSKQALLHDRVGKGQRIVGLFMQPLLTAEEQDSIAYFGWRPWPKKAEQAAALIIRDFLKRIGTKNDQRNT